jgi:dTDP-4-dehydrorhamnose reductase
MRLLLTGGSGFVGSSFRRVLVERHGVDVLAPSHAELDLLDADAVLAAAGSFRPDAIVHAAILNDFGRLYRERRLAWDAYVGATRHVVDAANAVRALAVLVSTDWVFDGTRPGATEDEPPHPVNLYGFLKAASELVVAERAARGAVARVGGVQGVHWARPATPRRQDAGFGYLVASIADTLRAGQPFTVWESDSINCIATPTLATDAADMVHAICRRGLTGTFHCVGGEAVDRRGLAELTVDVFGLDRELLRFGPPPADAVPDARVPYDTSLDATRTAAALGVTLPSVRELVERLRVQLDTGRLA